MAEKKYERLRQNQYHVTLLISTAVHTGKNSKAFVCDSYRRKWTKIQWNDHETQRDFWREFRDVCQDMKNEMLLESPSYRLVSLFIVHFFFNKITPRKPITSYYEVINFTWTTKRDTSGKNPQNFWRSCSTRRRKSNRQKCFRHFSLCPILNLSPQSSPRDFRSV